MKNNSNNLMTCNRKSNIATIASIAVLFTISIGTTNIYADEAKGYSIADNTRAIVTFDFRDGQETHEFPVFSMTSNFASNSGTTFEVQGVVDDGPYFHEALDEAFKYRMMKQSGASFEYDYRYFDADVQIVNDERTIRILQYANCEILDYAIDTLKDDYESYISSSSGFAIVDDIEFLCSGLSLKPNHVDHDANSKFYEHEPLSFTFAEDVRSVLTFEFDYGVEVVEFALFELKSGFEEGNTAGPSFHVEGIADSYPFLDKAVNDAQKVSNIASGLNTDFEVTAEFVNGDNVIRALDFADCRVSDYEIITYQDKEEGYTGKRGFSLVDTFDFTCAGMTPINPQMNDMKDNSSNGKMSNQYITNPYNMGTGAHAIATITFNDGVEVIDFPVFEQTGNLLSKNNPALEFVGVPGYYPMLYAAADAHLKHGPNSSGVTGNSVLFDVDVDLTYAEKIIRGYSYSDCRVVDYVIKTQHDKEESYFKGFALTNEFHLECKGYHPNNPMYDAMFVVEKANTQSSMDLRNTDQWPPGFSTE